jgi:hypothetical protein
MKLTDIDVSKSSQLLAERIDFCLIHLDLLALIVLVATLLLSMEAHVLEQNDSAVRRSIHCVLNLFTNTVLGEGHLLAQQLLELRHDGGEAVLWVRLAVRAAEM